MAKIPDLPTAQAVLRSLRLKTVNWLLKQGKIKKSSYNELKITGTKFTVENVVFVTRDST